MPGLHLKQPGFTYRTSRTFTKHREGIKKFWETGNLKHSHRNEIKKACFSHDATYNDSKDLAKRAISDKKLIDGAYEIARNHKYDGYLRALASMVYRFFDKKTPVIKTLKGRKVYSRFQDNI